MNTSPFKTVIPYGRQSIDSRDVRAVVRALRAPFITQGPRIQEFEERVAVYAGAQYGVAFSSGTAALHAASFAAGICQGMEAITSPISFVATSNAVLFQQGKPLFADVCPDTMNLDPCEVEKKITKRTQAIIGVDFAGHPADWKALKKIASRNKLFLIDDAAHALGASMDGRKTGSFADVTIFSFHPVKHITTGEGGMAVTSDARIYKKLLRFRNHGIVRTERLSKRHGPWYYEVAGLGYNYRITDIQCALGLSQMRKIETFIKIRRELAARYCEKLSAVEEIHLPHEKPGFKSSYHLFVIRLDLKKIKTTRRTIFEGLRAQNIGVNVHYIPIHLQPYYRERFGYKPGSFPVAEAYYESAITLPLFPKMGEKAVDQISAALKAMMARYKK